MFAYTADEIRRMQPGRGLAQVLCMLPTTTRHRLESLGLRRRRGTRAGRNQQRPIDVIVLRNHRSLSRPRPTRPTQRIGSPHCRRTDVNNVKINNAGHRERTLVQLKQVDIRRDTVKVGSLNAGSVSNKHTVINDLITSKDFSFFAVVESWHESSRCPDVIACTPQGYQCIDKARPRLAARTKSTVINHGGICLFYKSCYAAREIVLPVYSTAEVLVVYIQGCGVNLVFVVIYRPGSKTVTLPFVREFADIIERTAAYAAPLVVLGDINVHLDDISSTYTQAVNDVLADFNLVQHVVGPTHRDGHTLDVFITDRSTDAYVAADPPLFSDHSLITASVVCQHAAMQSSSTAIKRRWSTFDIDAFRRNLAESELINNPPEDCSQLVQLYDDTLKKLLDQHAPLRKCRPVRRPTAPWYDAHCRRVKATTRRLEKMYRKTRTDDARRCWREQFEVQRRTFQQRYADYWRSVISDSGDSKTLWRRLNSLLQPAQSVVEAHSADEFAKYFTDKIDIIRSSTSDSPPPTICPRQVTPVFSFSQVDVGDVQKALQSAPCKQCDMDPAPTRLIKQCSDLLSPVLTTLVNQSFSQSTFPLSQKHAVIKPILKKPNLDPCDCKSYRPISNLTFMGKFIERMAVKQFYKHCDTHSLLPTCQSAYRPHHSTETAIASVHNYIARAVDDGEICLLVLLNTMAAFDTDDHEIILDILERRFSMQSNAFKWFSFIILNWSHSVCTAIRHYYIYCNVLEILDICCVKNCAIIIRTQPRSRGSAPSRAEFIAYTEELQYGPSSLL